LKKQSIALLFVFAICLSLPLYAQRGARGAGGGGSGRQHAPIDLTGYWVSVINEDWEFRMVTPDKGIYDTLNLSAEGRRVAGTWDPAKDEAAGEQCRAYGAANLMRLPGRLHITWENDTTLRIDVDAGTQTRLFRFTPAPPRGDASWQGDSRAQWQQPARGRGAGAGPPLGGSLMVTTDNLRAGYLRKNGVPYSANATLTEYFDRVTARNGDVLLVVTTIVNDPLNLRQPFIVSTQFKQQADASGWDPTPCSSTW